MVKRTCMLEKGYWLEMEINELVHIFAYQTNNL